MTRTPRLVALIALLGALSTACAIASETVDPNAGIPEISGQCAPGFPECDDTAILEDDATIEPEANDTDRADAVPAPDTVIEFPSSDWVVVYLLAEDASATGPSPSLIPAARTLAIFSAPVTDRVRTTVEFLLAGPLPGEIEAVPRLTTAIPEGTRLVDLTVEGGIATIDLSSEFAAPGGTFGEAARIEQVLFTLTRFDEIDGVEFRIEGVPVDVFGGHGIVLDHPAHRMDLATSVPPILIEVPAYWEAGDNPLVVSGTSTVFEGTVDLALVDGDGLILWEGFVTATCGNGCRGDWAVEIPYDVEAPQMGAIIAWETSAQDGSRVNVREHPVLLVPATG